MTGVTALTFQYYDGTGWRDSWDTTDGDTNNTLPYAVRMTVTLMPERSGDPPRVLTRFATVWCAAKTQIDSNNSVAASQVASTQPQPGDD